MRTRISRNLRANRRRALDRTDRQNGGALTDDETMKIALEAQRWARRKLKARAKAK
jgi:hypothetical protein